MFTSAVCVGVRLLVWVSKCVCVCVYECFNQVYLRTFACMFVCVCAFVCVCDLLI